MSASIDVKRYDYDCYQNMPFMVECEDGSHVEYDDYKALRDQRDHLRARVAELEKLKQVARRVRKDAAPLLFRCWLFGCSCQKDGFFITKRYFTGRKEAAIL